MVSELEVSQVALVNNITMRAAHQESTRLAGGPTEKSQHEASRCPPAVEAAGEPGEKFSFHLNQRSNQVRAEEGGTEIV